MAALQEGRFTLEDFLEQMQQLKKMGPLSGLVGMIPGLPKEIRSADVDDDALKPIEAIIHSMTPEERRNPSIISGSRRSRIARGSGTTTADVNSLLDRFKQMQTAMRGLSNLPGIGRRMSKATAKGGRKSNKKKKRGR
jgi:signal recognition particle subunit SRP54